MDDWNDWEVEWALMSSRERRSALYRGDVPGHVLVFAAVLGRVPSDDQLRALGEEGARERVERGLRYARMYHLASLMTAAAEREKDAAVRVTRANADRERWARTGDELRGMLEADLRPS